jgi:4-hydroxy-3-polyprenylbenzoate decarboxylase
MNSKNTYVIAVSGASGSIYGRTAVEHLLESGAEVYLILSTIAKQVWNLELKETVKEFAERLPKDLSARLHIESNADLGARISSGSFRHNGMLVIPCSVKCLSGVASGYAGTLIERAADVSLKERFPLTLVVRETPLNLIHIENMARVTKAGGVILPASPGFYHGDISVEGLVNFVVGKAFDSIGIKNHKLFKRWKSDDEDA